MREELKKKHKVLSVRSVYMICDFVVQLYLKKP